MTYSIFDSLFNKGSSNIFANKDPTSNNNFFFSNYDRPDRLQLNYGNDKTIITPIINRIALDCCNKRIQHVILDDNGQYIDDVDSGLNRCLNLEANIDQTGRSLVQDIVMSMLDEGVVAVIPTDVTLRKSQTVDQFSTYDIDSMRVGKVVGWHPTYVDVLAYNEKVGERQQISIDKKKCAIIENPLYAVMNGQNSVAKRLLRKLAILDVINDKQGSDKLNLIIKLPYSVKNELRQELARKRIEDITNQLANNKFGIAYMDNTEQLEKIGSPIENEIMSVVEYLTSMLYGQLGMPKEIFEGNASEMQINIYMNTTIKPILNAIKDEFNRKFLTKTARSQGHSIQYYINPFDYVTMHNVADLGDKLTRNAIMTSNEFRSILGLNPSDQPIADELSNKNMPMDMQDAGYYGEGYNQMGQPYSPEEALYYKQYPQDAPEDFDPNQYDEEGGYINAEQ